jgi:hypothetical protein
MFINKLNYLKSIKMRGKIMREDSEEDAFAEEDDFVTELGLDELDE